MDFLITQTIGGIGYSLLALSYFKKEKRKILFIQIIAYILFSIHYYLLNGITGAVCNLIGLIALISIYVFEQKSVKNKNILTIGLLPFVVAISLITYQNIFSLFPIVALVIVILSFLTDDENIIRIIGVISAVCWLVYAIVYKSYVAIIFEVIILASACIAFFKNRKKRGQ